jgi:hypothetical protein
MALNVEYGPISLAGALAASAGQAQGQAAGQQASLGSDLSLLQTVNQRYGQDQAFRLQNAMAQKTLAAQMRTPAADHIAEQAEVARQTRTNLQASYKTQLDKMLSSGTIDEGQYQKGMLAVMTGNETLMQHILATPKVTAEKPNISNAEEIDIIRQPFREKRKMLEQTLQKTNAEMVKFASMPKFLEPLKRDAAKNQAALDASFAEETAAIDQWRKTGGKPEVVAPSEGTGTMTSQIPGTSLWQTGSLGKLPDKAQPPAQAGAPSGKPLDKETAAQFLRQAGGDNEKARALARLQGYAV